MPHMSDAKQWAIQISSEIPCSSYTDPDECIAANCFWYNTSCHSEPQEIPWLLYVGIATVVVGGIAVIIKRWR